MASEADHSLWTKKGATLSDKTAQKEFGLTEQDIIEAIREGKLQYRHNTLFGNPCLKLLRTEIEALVTEKYGDDSLKNKKMKNELTKVNADRRSLKRKIASLEKKKSELSAILGS